MAEQIGSIFVDVSADIASFVHGLKEAKEHADKEGKSIGEAAAKSMQEALRSAKLTAFPGIGDGGPSGTMPAIADAGEKAAKGYGERFSKGLSDWYEKSRDRIASRFEKLLDPERFMKSLTEGFKTLNEGGSFGAALETFIKNVPLVGASYELGKEAGKYFWGAFSDDQAAANAIEEAMSKQEKALEEMRKRATDRAQRDKEEQQKARDAMFGDEQSAREKAKWRAQTQGDEYEAALQDSELKLLELRKRLAEDLTRSTSDEETQRIHRRFEEEKAFLAEQLQYEYDEINRKADEAAAKEQQRQDELLADQAEKAARLAEREQEQAMKAAERLAEQELKDARDREEMIQKYRDKEAEAASAVLDKTTMSASTAIGEYRFSAYPAQKQAIDMMKIVTAVQTMAQMMPRIGFGGII